MIVRGLTMSAALMVAVVEPSLGEFDLVRYAITQGGLLAVALVLIWQLRGLVQDQRQQARSLSTLVEHSTTALINSTAAIVRQAEVGERVARALENLERRHR